MPVTLRVLLGLGMAYVAVEVKSGVKGKMVITASREVYIDNIIKYSLMNLG